MFSDVELVKPNKIDEAVNQTASSLITTVSDLAKGDLSAIGILGERYLVPSVLSLLIIIVGYFLARFASRVVQTPICNRVDQTLGKFVGKLVFYGVVICVLLWRLSAVGINVTSFTAVLAAAGFAVGLAFQGTLSNFAAGVLLLVFRPFKVGDSVVAAGVTGKVDEIDLFTTTLDTPDNRRIIVPNSSISGATIENMTHHKHRRIDLPIGVSYHASLDRTRAALTNAAESLRTHLIDGEGRGYKVGLNNLGASSVDWSIQFWTSTKGFGDVKEKLIAAIKTQLDEANISIPFPQLDIHLHDAAQQESKHDESSLQPLTSTYAQPANVSSTQSYSALVRSDEKPSATIPFALSKLRPRMRGDQKSDAA
jgi:small conductance mechanosensitive channel